MAQDVLHAIDDADLIIAHRKRERETTNAQFRAPIAAELIADDLTRLVAEVRTLRYLLAKNMGEKQFSPGA